MDIEDLKKNFYSRLVAILAISAGAFSYLFSVNLVEAIKSGFIVLGAFGGFPNLVNSLAPKPHLKVIDCYLSFMHLQGTPPIYLSLNFIVKNMGNSPATDVIGAYTISEKGKILTSGSLKHVPELFPPKHEWSASVNLSELSEGTYQVDLVLRDPKLVWKFSKEKTTKTVSFK